MLNIEYWIYWILTILIVHVQFIDDSGKKNRDYVDEI